MNFADPDLIEMERRLVTTCAYRPECIDLVDAADTDFFTPLWGKAMGRLRELRQADEPIDPIILAESVQGMQFTDLALDDVTAPLVPQYSLRITQSASKRRLLLGLSNVKELAKAGESADTLLSAACQAITDATLGQRDEALAIGKLISDRYLELGKIAEAKA